MQLFRALFIAATLIVCHVPASADTDMACPRPPARGTQFSKVRVVEDPYAPTTIRARNMEMERDNIADLDGMAELIRGGNRITADHLRYEKPTATAQAEGDVQLRNAAGDNFSTERLQLQLDTHIGEAGPSRYTISNNRARGDATRIEFLGPDHTRLTDVRYTTCREDQDDWFLNVSRLDLDTDEDIGTARHATVDFFGIPLFYFPYMNFSISDQRKSGFLAPRFSHSGNFGNELATPYYFNLAPNYDDTLTPRILTKRGLQLQNEFRYLGPDSNSKFDFEVLPNDKVAAKTDKEDDRAAAMFRYQHTFNSLWSGNMDLRGVSDKDYLVDFGDHIGVTSQTHLPQIADVTYRGSSWTFATRLVDHQTVDKTITPAERPYARLPQLQLVTSAPPLPNHWYPQLESEWNRFQHSILLTGERLNLNTGLSLPLQNDWAFFTPKVGARSIGYHLDRTDDVTPSITRGVLSFDTGLFFERDTQWDGRATSQTLEPRLFYLYVPAKNQDTLPNFDSGVPDLSFSALFRENRFTGGDRVGDANQITTAVTTRFLDMDEGIERLRLSLGRIYYLDDREVNIPASTQTRTASDYVAEASAWLVGNWHARETLQWNPWSQRVERNSFYMQYQPTYNKIFNIGQVLVRDQSGNEQVSQIDISTEWPIVGRWTMRVRSLHSLHDNRNVETYAGLEYNACCWAMRLTASRRWQDTEQDQTNAIQFEFQLTGLSKLGSSPESPLKQGLFSFQNQPKENTATE